LRACCYAAGGRGRRKRVGRRIDFWVVDDPATVIELFEVVEDLLCLSQAVEESSFAIKEDVSI
jgi:hypothetical protein